MVFRLLKFYARPGAIETGFFLSTDVSTAVAPCDVCTHKSVNFKPKLGQAYKFSDSMLIDGPAEWYSQVYARTRHRTQYTQFG